MIAFSPGHRAAETVRIESAKCTEKMYKRRQKVCSWQVLEDGTLRKWKRLQLCNIHKNCENATFIPGIHFVSLYIFYNLRYNGMELSAMLRKIRFGYSRNKPD